MDFFKRLFQQIISIWKKLETRQKIAFVLSFGVFLTTFCIFLSWATRPDYSVLYSDLSLEEAGEITGKLKEQKIPYRLEDGGRAVLVPTSQVYETRLNLAMEGIPRGGEVGFEIFDNTGLIGMTNFMEKINYQRALQGELARTIESMDEVVRARVHLVLPDESPFLGEESSPRASIVVKLRSGIGLRKNQIIGIAKLIAGSVKDLKIQNVTIVDQNGNILFTGEETDSPFYLTTNQIEMKKEVEKYLTNKVQTLLSSVVGPDRAVVRVNAELNFDQITRTEEYYDPESKVVKSEIKKEESSEGTTGVIGGAPGVKTNLGQENLLTMGTPGKETREESSVEYAINKRMEQIVKGAGNIEKISVAVAIDGIYQTGPGGTKEYLPRSEQEMEKLTSMVKQAVGYDESRGDKVTVSNVPFDTSYREAEEIQWQKLSRWELIRHLSRYIIIAVVILILFLSLRTLIKLITPGLRSRLTSPEEGEKILPLEDEEWLRERIFQLADQEPAKVAQIIKVWITNHGRA